MGTGRSASTRSLSTILLARYGGTRAAHVDLEFRADHCGSRFVATPDSLDPESKVRIHVEVPPIELGSIRRWPCRLCAHHRRVMPRKSCQGGSDRPPTGFDIDHRTSALPTRGDPSIWRRCDSVSCRQQRPSGSSAGRGSRRPARRRLPERQWEAGPLPRLPFRLRRHMSEGDTAHSSASIVRSLGNPAGISAVGFRLKW